MHYLSVSSGIESATVAWQTLEWQAVAFSEIEPYPCALLKHHYPDVPNWGDMTKFKEWPDANADLLVGGTPCQSFSVAGLRKGLDDPRGNLMLTYLAIAGRYRPRWLVWENVPGVLSSNGGKDFGSFLGGLAELGYGFAYRILDAKFFGVPQRRRRVFVVGCLGNWRAAAAVLFERHSLSGYPAPSRETGERIAAHVESGVKSESLQGFRMTAFGEYANDNTASAMKARDYKDATDLVACVTGDKPHVLAPVACMDVAGTMKACASSGGWSNSADHAAAGYMQVTPDMQVRRLTPVECERLQGFPDGYTNVPFRGKPVTDGHRYKALGNSKAVPVVRWIGERIVAVERISNEFTDT